MKNDLNIVTTNDGSHSIFSSKFNENYHSKYGSILEAEHVFIKNGLLATKKNNLKILEVGFGSGLNTLLTSKYCLSEKIKTDYHSLEIYPINEDIYNKLNFYRLVNIKKNDFISLHNSKWNVPFIVNKYFKLTKIHIDLKKFTTNSRYDIIFFDAFSPEKQPDLWDIEMFNKMFHLLVKNGFLVTYCAKGVVKRTLKSAGFKVLDLDGPPGKRQMIRANKLIIQK